MPFLLDTSVAVHLRDGEEAVVAQFEALTEKPFLSALTRVELEGGIYAKPQFAAQRRAAVDTLLTFLPVLDFDSDMAEVYGTILQATGFSRRTPQRRAAASRLRPVGSGCRPRPVAVWSDSSSSSETYTAPGR